MAFSLGTRGDNGKSLVRDKKKFDHHYDQINWKSKNEHGRGNTARQGKKEAVLPK